MIPRKLVKAGAASFTVALPKDWITKNNLSKGDTIYVKNISSNELIVSTELKIQKKEQKEKVIEIEDKEIGTIQREITSAYINDYDQIRIQGKSLYKNIKKFRDILSDFVAMEITEQTSNSLLAKDMLNLSEVSIEKTIRRMDNIVRSLFNDLISFEEDMSESVSFRDSDINRLYFLLFKIVKSSLRNPEIAKIAGVKNYDELLNIWYLILNLESISDNIKEIYFSTLKIKGQKYYDSLFNIYKKINEAYLKVMKAHYNEDRKLADDVASGRIGIFDECSKIIESSKNVTITQIAEDLKQIENLICNISRNVLDKI